MFLHSCAVISIWRSFGELSVWKSTGSSHFPLLGTSCLLRRVRRANYHQFFSVLMSGNRTKRVDMVLLSFQSYVSRSFIRLLFQMKLFLMSTFYEVLKRNASNCPSKHSKRIFTENDSKSTCLSCLSRKPQNLHKHSNSISNPISKQ